ncbi:hypothetical protein FSP39_013717 [Pinctada imbricata]|uniref:DUF4605 domain-containing protein n=1 Tax=Pinctada imbricata TaxID=66713 RepID=A0AA88XS76_PINIB|nr:hypothetical protein FSP39_013717 [Pinctada imbricata]
MVKILSTGEIVQDDDPRAKQGGAAGTNTARPRQGYIRHDDDAQQQQGGGFGMGGGGGGGGGGGEMNIFTALNNKLIDLGVPRFNVGPYVVEPIALVGFILAALLFGLPGVIFGAVLFLVVTSSQNTNAAAQGGNQRGGFQGGGGHRLG